MYLCDIGQPNGVGHNANTCNENLSSVPEQPRELIHQSSDEALHCAELQTNVNNAAVILHLYGKIVQRLF